MRPRLRLAASVLLFGLLAGCGSRAPEVTGLVVTVELDGVAASQLDISVDSPTARVVSQQRPEKAGAPLTSPQSVTVFLPDTLANTDVTCTVAPLDGGKPSAPAVTGHARLTLHKLVPLTIKLTAAPFDGGADGPDADAGTGAAGADGAAGTGGVDGASDGKAGTSGTDGSSAKANGQPCASGAECDSAMCVDGFCCNSACAGSCEACNLRNQEGLCSPVAAGDPVVGGQRTACADQGAALCNFDGKCDGNGACRKYQAGVVCKQASCQGTTFVAMSACDGQGACVTPKDFECAPFKCVTAGSAAACASTCTTGGGECVPPAVCTNGSCGMRPRMDNGAGCLADADCVSNHCADGVCCNMACTGACVSCNQMGSEGMCLNVPENKADPHRVCTDAGAASCGKNGLCNGAGACQLYPATTVCLAGSCKNTTKLAPTRHCDGNGTCVVASDTTCTPFRCNAAVGACFKSCSDPSSCAPGYQCQNAICH